MSYIYPCRLVFLAAVCAAAALGAGVCVAADDSRSKPLHEDHGAFEPIAPGTDSAACASGVSGGFACNNVELLARLPLDAIGGGSGSDSWGWKDIATHRYYALVARSNGTAFVEVTDPEAPVYLGNLPSTSGNAPWRDVKVYANHAFIVADGIADHGMQVFDLTRLRGVNSPQTFAADALYTGVGAAHNVAINEQSGFAYIVGSNSCSGGLHMVDIATPKSPVFAGCFSGDGYTHDVQCVSYAGPDADHAGSELCFAANEDSLTIVDVSDKSTPVLLGKAQYPGIGYSHQGWLSDDHAVFFMGDEADELGFGMNTRTL
ncbi:MAG: choice-of-anchor B family protein, partial [Xanthomonadales bacterium]|nr:choice-of-anchor B family protein [Xanthomonadales bacterium]